MKYEDCKVGMKVMISGACTDLSGKRLDPTVGSVVACMDPRFALVYLGKHFDGHSGDDPSMFEVPNKYKGHCWWFKYDELTSAEQQAKPEDKKDKPVVEQWWMVIPSAIYHDEVTIVKTRQEARYLDFDAPPSIRRVSVVLDDGEMARIKKGVKK